MKLDLQVLRSSALVIGLVLLVLALWYVGHVLLLIFGAILLAIFLRGLATQISDRTPAGPGLSLALVLCGILALAIGFGFYLTPRLKTQASELRDSLPQAWNRVEEYARTLPFGEQIIDQASGTDVISGETVQSTLPDVFSVTLKGVVEALFVLVTGIYLAARPRTYVQGVLRLVPRRHRGRACEVLGATGYTLQWWLIGQVIVMVIVGVTTATGLALLGIPLALILGVIAGLLDFVPNVGPIVAAIPAILIALLVSPQAAFYVVLLYIGIQQLEGYILTPLIQKKTVELEPALIITAQLAFGLTVGALGVLLATPLTAVALVAVKMLYIENVLGEDMDVDGTRSASSVCTVDPA